MARHESPQDERAQVLQDFRAAVNMTPAALERWLDTEESRQVGFTHDGERESVGHQSGRRIVELLHKKRDALDDGELSLRVREADGTLNAATAVRVDPTLPPG